jgi:hypothetical protein
VPAITDYDSLVAEIVATLVDSDQAAKAPRHIQMAESTFNRRLHNPEGEATATTATVAGDATLAFPSGFRSIRSIYLETDPRTLLTYMTPGQLLTLFPGSASGQPRNYTISDDQILLAPAPDATYTVNLTYVGTLTALSPGNPTNWLLAKHPDLYLYAALGHAELDGWNDERTAGVFKPYVDEIIDEINQEGLRRMVGPGLRMRPSVQERI